MTVHEYTVLQGESGAEVTLGDTDDHGFYGAATVHVSWKATADNPTPHPVIQISAEDMATVEVLLNGAELTRDTYKGEIGSKLARLRRALRAERISWGELADLQSLAEHIDPGDVELLEAAGVPEFPESTCNECGVILNETAELVSPEHLEWCSLHPDNTARRP